MKTTAPEPRAARMRLQKYLSDAGIASRRHAEEMVLEGRVLINDRVVESLPAFVDPARDVVVVDGAPVHIRAAQYWLVHKPKGVVCTNSDPDGRRRAIDLLPPLEVRLFPVGRLDADSSGLLLMTNDGELALQFSHPRFGIPKVYRAEVRGIVEPAIVQKLKDGVWLSEGRAQASSVRIIHTERQATMLEITLREGRNRQVRRMLARLGHPVRKLKRIQIGSLSLKGLPLGGARLCSDREIADLQAELAAAVEVAGPRRRRPRRRITPPADAPATSVPPNPSMPGTRTARPRPAAHPHQHAAGARPATVSRPASRGETQPPRPAKRRTRGRKPPAPPGKSAGGERHTGGKQKRRIVP
ncbi:MAG: pseudouridine synthase [Phycisphaerae bacterium]